MVSVVIGGMRNEFLGYLSGNVSDAYKNAHDFKLPTRQTLESVPYFNITSLSYIGRPNGDDHKESMSVQSIIFGADSRVIHSCTTRMSHTEFVYLLARRPQRGLLPGISSLFFHNSCVATWLGSMASAALASRLAAFKSAWHSWNSARKWRRLTST